MSSGIAGLQTLNLRSLGANRLLVLLDGRRTVGSSYQGIIDIASFPRQLVQRVDVVTGGASASYGSDAVGGVVNFITMKHFEGFKANVEGGVTTYGDDAQGPQDLLPELDAPGDVRIGGRSMLGAPPMRSSRRMRRSSQRAARIVAFSIFALPGL